MRAVILTIAFLTVTAAAARAACTNPSRPEGDQFYNADHKTFQFCDGTTWWSMKGAEVTLPACSQGDGIVMTSAGWACSPGGPP